MSKEVSNTFTKQKLTGIGIRDMIANREKLIGKLQQHAEGIAQTGFLGGGETWKTVRRYARVIKRVGESKARLEHMQPGITTLNVIEERGKDLAEIRESAAQGYLLPTTPLHFEEAYQRLTASTREPGEVATSIEYIQDIRAQQQSIWKEHLATQAITGRGEAPVSRRTPLFTEPQQPGMRIEEGVIHFANGKSFSGKKAQLLRLISQEPQSSSQLQKELYGEDAGGQAFSGLRAEAKRELQETGYSLINLNEVAHRPRSEAGLYLLVEQNYGLTPAEVRMLAALTQLQLMANPEVAQVIQLETVKPLLDYGAGEAGQAVDAQVIDQRRQQALAKLEERMQKPYAETVISFLQSVNQPVGDFLAQLAALNRALQQSEEPLTLSQFLARDTGKGYQVDVKSGFLQN